MFQSVLKMILNMLVFIKCAVKVKHYVKNAGGAFIMIYRIYVYLIAALKAFEHFHLFTKNWGRNWGIFDPNDFHKLFL